MTDINSLSHSKLRCQYHIVFAPKYRREEIYGKIKADIGEILRKLCEQKRVEINSGFHILLLNTDDAKAYLNFSGTRADCAAIVDGKSGTSKITATAYLKRVEGNVKTVVKSWTGLSTTDESFYFDQSYYVASGYTYEFELDAGVTRNGVTE